MAEPRWIIDKATGCWEWRWHRNRDGYGTCRANGRHTTAHRAVYEELIGVVPPGLEVEVAHV